MPLLRPPDPSAEEVQAAAEAEQAPSAEELPKLSDDPIRMYLSQMANIPLLSREEEISLAKKIEVARKRFRRTVLSCDCAMRATVETLKKVYRGELPFDRTIKVSLTERLTNLGSIILVGVFIYFTLLWFQGLRPSMLRKQA